MKLKDPNLQQKLQEMCDCYMETDFVDQLAAMAKSKTKEVEENALKYLALAIMYGITEKADRLTLKNKLGKTRAVLKTSEGKIKLPKPSAKLFTAIANIMRKILHFEGTEGSSQLALGLRNSQLDLQVSLKEKEKKTSLRITFPELGE